MLADFQQEIPSLRNKISSAKQILILLPENLSIDSLAAALALHLALKKTGKQSMVACPKKLTVEFSALIGVDEVRSEINGKNFVISLDYKEGAIEKVSYNIENGKFNLIIKPRESENWELDEKHIHFHKQGVVGDLIFTVGCTKLEDLGKFYTDEQEIYSNTEIINIDNNIVNESFGKVNLISPISLTISEVVCQILQTLGVPFDKDMSTNLLHGVDVGSDYLQSDKIEADTLEVAAFCLRQGAQRILKIKNNVQDIEEKRDVLNKALKMNKNADDDTSAPSPDWLAPKIYKGSTLL